MYNFGSSCDPFLSQSKKDISNEEPALVIIENISKFSRIPSLFGTQNVFLSTRNLNLDINFQIGNDCLVGQGATIGDKVSVKRSIIGKHCMIGDKVKITNSVILDHVTVGEG